MTKYRKILRLQSLRFSERNIARSRNVSRLYGRAGMYSTVTEHMPQDHQKYLVWNGNRFRRWAESIGTNTNEVVNAILTSGRAEQQSYRSCMGLLRPAEKYSETMLEAARKRALSYTNSPSYKSIKILLVTMKEVSFEDRFGMLIDVEQF